MTAGTRLVTLPSTPGAGARFNKTDSILVYANTDTDAIDIAKNYFPGNPNLDALWALATVTRPVAGADLSNWSARVVVASPTGVVKADVTASVDPATKASGIFTLTGAPTAGDTVTIGGVAYTFVSPVGVTAGNVLFSTAANACSNLILAINAGAGGGTNYVANSPSPDANVSAAAGVGTSVVLTALLAGAAGNSVTTTASITGQASAMPNATLLGGSDANTVDALGEDLVTLLNASVGSDGMSYITHASYATDTHTLTAAGTADGLGDHTLSVYFYPPDGNRHPVASFVSTITDVGSAGDALTVILVASNPIPSLPISALVNPFY